MIKYEIPKNYLEFQLCFTDVLNLVRGEISDADDGYFEDVLNLDNPEEHSVANLMYWSFYEIVHCTLVFQTDYEPDYNYLKERYERCPDYLTAELISFIQILNKFDAVPYEDAYKFKWIHQ